MLQKDALGSGPLQLDGCGILPKAEPQRTAAVAENQAAPSFSPVPDISEAKQRLVVVRAYALMVVGLLLSAFTANWAAERFAEGGDGLANRAGFEALFLFQLVAVPFLASFVPKLSTISAAGTFFGFAAFNGVSFCFFMMFIPPNALAQGFLLTAVTFAVMAAYGHVTKRELGSVRSMVYMVLVGIGVLAAVNLGLGSSAAYWATSFLGIVAFAILTSMHAVDLSNMVLEFEEDASGWKAAFCGALLLYLDFVNLYLLMMRAIQSLRSNDDSQR